MGAKVAFSFSANLLLQAVLFALVFSLDGHSVEDWPIVVTDQNHILRHRISRVGSGASQLGGSRSSELGSVLISGFWCGVIDNELNADCPSSLISLYDSGSNTPLSSQRIFSLVTATLVDQYMILSPFCNPDGPRKIRLERDPRLYLQN